MAIRGCMIINSLINAVNISLDQCSIIEGIETYLASVVGCHPMRIRLDAKQAFAGLSEAF